MRLDRLQKEQVELGRAHGLTRKQIRFYAKRKYNFLKMEQLRLCVEEGLSKYDCRQIARHCTNDRQMAYCRKKLLQQQEIFYPISLKYWMLALCLLLALVPLGYHLYQRKQPILELNAEEIRLKQGEDFDAMRYLSTYSKEKGTLILPVVDTATCGNHIAVYRLETNGKEITRILHVNIAQ